MTSSRKKIAGEAPGVEVYRNDDHSIQIEWKHFLLTLNAETPHGIAGSLAVRDGTCTRLLAFHGESREKPFPMTFHESAIDENGRDI